MAHSPQHLRCATVARERRRRECIYGTSTREAQPQDEARRRGETCLALVVLIGWGYGKYRWDHDLAVGELKDYLHDMYEDRVVVGTSCAGTDSDGNGYISCEGRVSGPKENPERVEVVLLECSTSLFSGGCKQRNVFPGTVPQPSAR